jgi:hypothetical protein
LGVYYPFKAAKLTMDIRALGLLCTALLPESIENITVPNNNNKQYNLKQSENSDSNIGYQLGIKMRYQLYKRLLFTASVDYTYSKVTFQNIIVTDTYSGVSIRTDDYTQKFQLIHFLVGIGIQFD